jgi:hypothetical protein
VKSRLLIFLSVVVMVFVLVALNAASYVRVEEEAETEASPDRSTQNTGGTGTRALFDYLQQRGADVVRWKQPIESLADGETPASFVIVGPARHKIERREAEALLHWVDGGGRLVLIDRDPSTFLLPASGRWRVASEEVEAPGPDARPDDAENMTRGVPLVAPAQPTALTRDVSEVTRSRFAARLRVYQADTAAPVATGIGGPRVARGVAISTPAPTPEEDQDMFGDESEPPPPPPAPATKAPAEGDVSSDSNAPVIHVSDGREGQGALLVDYAYGRGRVVVLSDPYVVSNAGINRSDNLFLAANVVTGGRRSGRVAFDEFHQGYGATQNQLFAYFRGTPILWMFAQVSLVALALVWTRGRRFARALPAPGPDRRSKLEFVASMAELQQRARAYDLAIENIYQRTRRALARYAGLPAAAPLEQIAERVAARSGRDRGKVESLLRECEESIAGAPLKSRRALVLARELRELERDLGILMRSREIRQAGAR